MNKIRIPIEQYSFIELDFEGSAEDTLNEYRRLTKMATGGVGMDTKDFNKILDEYLTTKSISGDPGLMESMNIEQQGIIQAIKRSLKRIN